jgi:hypothetical protein
VELRSLATFDVEVGAPVDLGLVDGAGRRCVPILGGRVTGGITGIILAGGADWQDVAPSGALEIAARYVIEVEDGHIEVESAGLRHGPPEVLARLGRGEPVPASEYYFRTSMRFRTASSVHRRLNSILGLAHGERRSGRVVLTVFEVT